MFTSTLTTGNFWHGSSLCIFVALPVISICWAETAFLYSRLPRRLKLTTFPWPGLLQKHVSLGDWSSKHQNSFVCLHKTCPANSQNYLVLKTILERKVAIIGVSSGQTVLLQEMSRRVCPSSCQFERNAFPSFVSLKLWRSGTQKLKLGEQVLWKRLIELMTFQWPVNVGNFKLNSWKHKLTSIV